MGYHCVQLGQEIDGVGDPCSQTSLTFFQLITLIDFQRLHFRDLDQFWEVGDAQEEIWQATEAQYNITKASQYPLQ